LCADIRTLQSLPPETLHYDPLVYIDLKKDIFIAMNTNKNHKVFPLSRSKFSTPETG